eukprot:gene28000-52747_t
MGQRNWADDGRAARGGDGEGDGGIPLVRMAHGARDSAALLRRKLFGPPGERALSVALRDYYPYWRDQKEADDAGKPLLVEDRGGEEGDGAHHIFFDDNVERDRAHI